MGGGKKNVAIGYAIRKINAKVILILSAQ